MDKPLREVLQGAIESRKHTLRNGSCHRTNYGHMLVCIGTCENILRSFYSDEEIRRVCIKHRVAVEYVVPGNQPAVLQALLGETKTQVQ